MPKKTSRRLDGIDHKRTPDYMQLNVDDLCAEELTHTDEIAIRMFKTLFSGKGHSQWARLPSELIVQGHFAQDETGQFKNVKNFEYDNFVDNLAIGIRSGLRSPICVYRSPFHNDEVIFVCPDDERTLLAYRSVGITMIPCTVLGAAPPGYASLSIFKKGNHASLRKVHPSPKPTGYFITRECAANPIKGLHMLVEYLTSILERLRRFHIEGETHYHHFLYSCVRNHIDAIEAIAILFQNNKVFQAPPIIRSMYEAYLNLFAEWLAPQRIGPLRQLLALSRRASDQSQIDKQRTPYEDYFPEKDTSLFGFADLLTNVRRKADLSPLGSHFYNVAYTHLSSVAHQDYVAMSENSSLLSSADGAPDVDHWVRQYTRWVDVITISLAQLLESDIGDI